MTGKIVPKPTRPQPSEEQIQRFIAGAPDERPVAPAPAAPSVPASAQPALAGAESPAAAAPAAEAPGKLPRALRKRKEPITVTVDPVLLDEFDKMADSIVLSRAAALGQAMQLWIKAEKKKAQE